MMVRMMKELVQKRYMQQAMTPVEKKVHDQNIGSDAEQIIEWIGRFIIYFSNRLMQ